MQVLQDMVLSYMRATIGVSRDNLVTKLEQRYSCMYVQKVHTALIMDKCMSR